MFLCQNGNSSIGILTTITEVIISLLVIYTLTKHVLYQINKSKRENYDILLISISLSYLIITVYSLIIKESYTIDILMSLIKFILIIILAGSLIFQYLIKNERNTIRYFKYIMITFGLFLLLFIFWYLTSLFSNDNYSQCTNKLDKTIVLVSFLVGLSSISFMVYNFMKESSSDHSFSMINEEYYHLDLLLVKQFKTIQKTEKYYLVILISSFFSSFLDFFIMFLYRNDLNSSNDTSSEPLCKIYYSVLNISHTVICVFSFFIKDILPFLSVALIMSIKPQDQSSKAFIELT